NNVELFNCAVGKENGDVFFADLGADDLNRVIVDSKGIKVPIRKLDDIINCSNISLIKIDVEGFEKFVLEGAIQTLKNTEILYFESWENHFNNYSYHTTDILGYLCNIGFKVFKISGEQLIELNINYMSMSCENLVAIRNVSEFLSRTGYFLKNPNNHNQ
ncbi:MAG: FkbM family methyltransferase, partial [Syntrophales bacterium LBB04]|nr:FkbM family methyltransferase [Syntrophales bacterium LBB04]